LAPPSTRSLPDHPTPPLSPRRHFALPLASALARLSAPQSTRSLPPRLHPPLPLASSLARLSAPQSTRSLPHPIPLASALVCLLAPPSTRSLPDHPTPLPSPRPPPRPWPRGSSRRRRLVTDQPAPRPFPPSRPSHCTGSRSLRKPSGPPQSCRRSTSSAGSCCSTTPSHSKVSPADPPFPLWPQRTCRAPLPSAPRTADFSHATPRDLSAVSP